MDWFTFSLFMICAGIAVLLLLEKKRPSYKESQQFGKTSKGHDDFLIWKGSQWRIVAWEKLDPDVDEEGYEIKLWRLKIENPKFGSFVIPSTKNSDWFVRPDLEAMVYGKPLIWVHKKEAELEVKKYEASECGERSDSSEDNRKTDKKKQEKR